MNVAVYWDFENIHASLCTLKFGPKWYRENCFSKQPQLADINSLMEYISGLGNVNINKAYANWSFLFSYNIELQSHAIDLIQLFPRGGRAKNGADIRMAIEVIEDITLNPHISTIVIVGGDSDYISIAQKVRQRGKSIIGIGVKETTNQYWIKSCNEFKFYSSLLVRSSSIADIESEGYEESDIEDAKELLCKAILQESARTGEKFVNKAAIKPIMMRLDPSFDESNFGFRSFTDFLGNFTHTISIKKGEFDHLISLNEDYEEVCEIPTPDPAHPYVKVLKKQQIRLVDPQLMNTGVLEAWNLFSASGQFDSFNQFRAELKLRLEKAGVAATETDISKIRALLYKVFAFKIDTENRVIRLNPFYKSAEDLLKNVHLLIVKRIMDHLDEKIDATELSLILYGSPEMQDSAMGLIAKYQGSDHSN